MNYRISILLLLAQNFVIGQNTVKPDKFCIPPPVTREIVDSDTLPMHHSFCFHIVKWDKNNKIVISSIVCDTSNGNTSFFFDDSQLGQEDSYYDTSGKIIFEVVSKNKVILECYTLYYGKSKRAEYREGYNRGQAVKINYEYNEYGNLSKKITTTSTEIRTIVYTDERDNYGNFIQKVTITPRNQDKN